MKKFKMLLLLFIATVVYSWSGAWATNSVSQKVTFGVQAINEIAISDHISILNTKNTSINSQGIKIINAVSTYAISTNESNKKITGVLSAQFPEDICLRISLEDPTGARSYDNVLLTYTPTDLVTGISKIAESGKKIRYQFSVPESMQLVNPLPQIITLTITD